MRDSAQRVTGALSLIAVTISMVACNHGYSQREAPQPPAQAATVTKPSPPTPLAIEKAKLGDDTTWDPQWDHVVETAIPAEMLSNKVPHDVRRFCPHFYQMSEVDKRAFWAYFFQALARPEAGLDPRTNVRHTDPEVAKVDGVTHQMVRSQGLLQLTYEDQERYGCNFDWDADRHLSSHDPDKTILTPENNLRCGIKILNNQIIAQHKPLLSSTSYWSTLQPGRLSYRVFLKQMTNPPAACGLSENKVQKRATEITASR
jgi:hypothetical protein